MPHASSSTAADQGLARLHAMQRLATGLLLLAAALYLLARSYEAVHPLVGYLRAFCEAAMVGGLADWFAVTALFRHPLRIPLPHTAIVPTNKDRIGATLGRFVEENFLASELVADKLGRIDFSAIAGRWLADPARSGPLTARLVQLLPRVLDAAGEEPVRHFLQRNFIDALKHIEMAPLAADLLELLTARNAHQALVDDLLRQAQRLLLESEPEIREKVRERTAWLWQRLGVDEKIADRLILTAQEVLAEVSADPEHAWRARFTAVVHDYTAALRGSAEYRARAEALKDALLAHPMIGSYIGAVWDQLRAQIRLDAAQADSRVAGNLRAALTGLGESLLADAQVREAFDAWLRAALLGLVEQRRHEVGTLIAETVRRWDAGTVSDRIERAIGRDLQYIRINGTLIGGLVGVALHVVSQLLH